VKLLIAIASSIAAAVAFPNPTHAHGELPIPPVRWALPHGFDLVATGLTDDRLDLFVTLADDRSLDGLVTEHLIEDIVRAALEDAYEAGQPVSGVIPWVAHQGQWVPLPSLLPPFPAVPRKAFELGDIDPSAAAQTPVVTAAGARRTGALTGKVVYVSAGHGFTWDPSLGRWATQRGNTHDIVEDLVSAETINQLLTTYLENAGATVFTVRERDMSRHMVIVDAGTDGASSVSSSPPGFSKGGYLELQGNWGDSTSVGFQNGLAPYLGTVNPFASGKSRVVATSNTPTASAAFTFEVPETGDFRVYAAWSAGTNRAPDARYVVHHAGGTSTFRVDQRRHGETWMSLGRFHFYVGESYRVELFNDSAAPNTFVSADAIRIGGGMGDAARGTDAAPPSSRLSGRPRWEENARYHIQFTGAPSSVYAYSSDERSDDVGARSRYAAWQNETGEDALYIAWHTNAPSPAVGTSTFVYGPNPPDGTYDFRGTEGSDRLGRLLHDEVVNDFKVAIDPSWRNRGLYTAYFGEVNPNHNPEMPAALCEVAFHSTESDAAHLKNPRVRNVAARAFYQAVVKYFAERDDIAAALSPEPPTNFAVTADGPSAILSWAPSAVDSQGLGGQAATGYRLYRSLDGRAFDDGLDIGPGVLASGRVTYRVDGLTPGEVAFFRVSASNAGGESMPSTVLGVNPPCQGPADALVVHAFHRLDAGLASREDLSTFALASIIRVVLDKMNRFDATVNHAHALAALQIPFDSAESHALPSLATYRLVDWVTGEESTADETFSDAEQAMVSAWLDASEARTLITSGAELAWDLGARGTPSDIAFLARLGAVFEADDAGTYTLASDAVSGALTLDDGTLGLYDVEFPDVLAAASGSGAEPVLRYGDGKVAGLRKTSGTTMTLTFGVPLEAVFPRERRELLFESLLADAAVTRLVDTCDGPIEPGPEPLPEPAPEPVEPNETDASTPTDGFDGGARPGTPSRSATSSIVETDSGCANGTLSPLVALVIVALVFDHRRRRRPSV